MIEKTHTYNVINELHERQELASTHPEIVEKLKQKIEAWLRYENKLNFVRVPGLID